MRTVGQMLKENRIAKGLTLEQVEKATKIRKKFLNAIELDDYTVIPSQAYTKGFIKNYSEYLGLNSRNMMAFFRRQTEEVSKSSLLPKRAQEAIDKPSYVITPSRFIFLLVACLLLLLLGYFGLQYRKLHIPPKLSVDSPKEQIIINVKRIDVTGSTDPDATVSINGVGVLVRSDGKFFDQVQLFPGKNTITIAAVSRYGKSSTVTRVVTMQEAAADGQ
jgi:transcriptional regulator with XRE-family HTH domain